MAGDASGIRAGRAFVELGVNDKVSAGLHKVESRLKSFSAGLRATGAGMTALAAGIAAPAAVAVSTFADFEQQMANVRSKTNATTEEFAALTAKARELGAKTVFSAAQAAAAMEKFAFAGFSVQKILKSIGPTLDLAAAGQIDMAAATATVVTIMAGMGIEAERVGEAVDVLTKAMTTANTDLLQLGDAMKYVGPIAKSAGVSFEETIAAIQLLSNAGIQADMAGTTLRGSILALTDPTKEAGDLLKKLGVNVKDARGDMRPLASIIDDLNRATAGLGKAEKLGKIGKIFDARQAAGFAELMSQGGDRLREFTTELGKAGGTAARIADIQMNTLSGDVERLSSATDEAKIALGTALGGAVRAVTRTITDAVGAVAQWIERNGDLIRKAALMTAGIGAIGAGLLSLSLAATIAAKVFGGLGLITGTVVAAFKLAVAAIAAMVSPIGLVIATVATLGTVVALNTGFAADALAWLGDRFRSLARTVNTVLSGISDAMAAGDIGLAAKVLWLAVKAAWQEGVAAISRVWLEGKRFLLTQFQETWTGMLAVAEFAWNAMKVGWIETTSFIGNTWTKMTAGISSAWNHVTSFLATQWATIVNLITKAYNLVVEILDRLTRIEGEGFDLTAANEAADQALVNKLRTIEEEKAANLKRIRDEKTATLAAIEDERQARRDAEQKRHEDRMRGINEAEDASLAALDKETDARLAGTREALDQARKDLDAALAEARDKRRAAEQEAAEAALPGAPKRPGLPGAEGIAQSLGTAARVAGQFGGLGLARLGSGGGPEEETAKNTRELVTQTKELRRDVKQGQPRFS